MVAEGQQQNAEQVGEAAGSTISGTSLEDFHLWDIVQCHLCGAVVEWKGWPEHEQEVGHQIERMRGADVRKAVMRLWTRASHDESGSIKSGTWPTAPRCREKAKPDGRMAGRGYRRLIWEIHFRIKTNHKGI